MVHVYKSLQELHAILARHEPISVIFDTDSLSLFLPCKNKGQY